MKDAVDLLNERIAVLEQENKELHATIMKLHHEYRPDVQDAARWQHARAVGFWIYKKEDDSFKCYRNKLADAAIDEAMK